MKSMGGGCGLGDADPSLSETGPEDTRVRHVGRRCVIGPSGELAGGKGRGRSLPPNLPPSPPAAARCRPSPSSKRAARVVAISGMISDPRLDKGKRRVPPSTYGARTKRPRRHLGHRFRLVRLGRPRLQTAWLMGRKWRRRLRGLPGLSALPIILEGGEPIAPTASQKKTSAA